LTAVRDWAENRVIYGTSSQTVWSTEGTTDDYFFVNAYDGSNQPIRLILRAHNLYVQGYVAPGTHIYYHPPRRRPHGYELAAVAQYSEAKLPFSSSYLGMERYAGQTMSSPTFSTQWARYNADQLSYRNTAGSVRAGALMWFVEAVAEGAGRITRPGHTAFGTHRVRLVGAGLPTRDRHLDE